jgi:stage III sporulation protein SpoIIIAA
VSIVDTHCEIGGYCDTPHAAVGISRRFMVGKREEQASVMMHCFQSQRPRVMVIDEVDSESDVMAAINCHRRGVRLIAGTTGSLSNVMEDTKLAPLVGEWTVSETGMRLAAKPVFDAIVELKSGALNQWRVITDTMDAVDSILDNRSYTTQLRIRDPEKGNIQLECERVFID